MSRPYCQAVVGPARIAIALERLVLLELLKRVQQGDRGARSVAYGRLARRDVRRFLPDVPVAGAEPVAGAVGFGVAGAASCASASNGSSVADSGG
jgi:hypothetical protein